MLVKARDRDIANFGRGEIKASGQLEVALRPRCQDQKLPISTDNILQTIGLLQ